MPSAPRRGSREVEPKSSDACPACLGWSRVSRTNDLVVRGGLELLAFRCDECGDRWIPTTPEAQRKIEEVYGKQYAGHRVDP